MNQAAKRQLAEQCDKETNAVFLNLLHKELSASYFNTVSEHTLITALGGVLKGTLYNYMGRSEYGDVMKNLFQKGDTEAIRKYHSEFVEKHAPSVIKEVFKVYHPNFSM